MKWIVHDNNGGFYWIEAENAQEAAAKYVAEKHGVFGLGFIPNSNLMVHSAFEDFHTTEDGDVVPGRLR